jgi:excisionase family DNA binding protein
MSSETYVTRNQIAKRLGVHAATVDRMAADGRLPCPIKLSAAVNGRIRFPAAAVEAAIEALIRIDQIEED